MAVGGWLRKTRIYVFYSLLIDTNPHPVDNEEKREGNAMLRKIFNFLLSKCRRERESLSAEEKLRIDMIARSR